MNKKFRIFVKIIYYIFTFGLGIVLALVLPGIYMYGIIAEDMNDSLFEGNYSNSMNLIGGYYNSEHVLQRDINNRAGFVLFEAATLQETPADDRTDKTPQQMKQVYAGFFYGLKKELYQYELEDKSQENKAILYAYNGDEQIKIEILNYDTNSDGTQDSINTLENFDYIYFEIPKNSVSKVTDIELINAKGETFTKISDLNLNYDTEFFTKVNSFVEKFNENNGDSTLGSLEENILAVDQFKKGDFGNAQSKATKRACIVVLVYFICIYIIADFLVGKHYIIKFTMFLIHKIKSRKKKGTEEPEHNEVYGTDYYTKLTIRLICEDEIVGNFSLHYHNENEELNFLFTKENNYTVVERTHAGEYYNGKLDCIGYQPVDFSETIHVRAFQMNVEIKIKKLEEGVQNKDIE